MNRLNTLMSGALLSIFIFLLYSVDTSISTLSTQNKSLNILSEEIKMARNYREFNKVHSNNYILSFCNLPYICNHPIQFITFCLYKNESLKLIEKKDERKLIAFIGKSINKSSIKVIVAFERKLLRLLEEGTDISDMAFEMLITVLKNYKFDMFTYQNKIEAILSDWYDINQFILKKHKIEKSDIPTIFRYLALYKLSEICYV